MSHISYAMIVHAESGRVVYKTRNKTGGDVEPAIKSGVLAPFDDLVYVGDILQPDYLIVKLTLDDHDSIDYATQRWDSVAGVLRDATVEEVAEYHNVVSTYAARLDVAANKLVVALIGALAPLHGLSAEQLTDAVVEKLRVPGE